MSSHKTNDADTVACNTNCKALFDIGVPPELRWVHLADTLRNISSDPILPDSVKREVQGLILPVFKAKEFTEENYRRLSAEMESHIHAQCHSKQATLMANIDSLVETLDLTNRRLDSLVGDKEGGMADIKGTASELATTLSEGNIEGAVSRMEALQSKIVQNMERAFTLKNELSERASFDALTKLANRRSFDERLGALTEGLVEGAGDAVSLIFADIDHFKKFNDTYGHKVGDSVLAAVAGELRDLIRGDDLAARYGGEEFVALVIGLGHQRAMARAEEIRQAVEGHQFVLRGKNEAIRVTVSIGVATLTPAMAKGKDPVALGQELIESADAALYRAKGEGRNRVVSHTPITV